MDDIQNRLKEKAVEAFLLAIEIYNKPTIKYRIEGFSFFIINAWELMMKAYLIGRDGPDSVYYKNQPERTLSIDNCIKKVFTNDKDPLRLNLEKIIELRNTSTHFITKEYEFIYIPLFQATVQNFCDKINEFLGEDMTKHVPENFLILPVSIANFDEEEIRAKYSRPVSSRILDLKQKVEKAAEENGSRFSIRIIHEHYLTKQKSSTAEVFRLAKNGESPVVIIKDRKDPSNTHPYPAKAVITNVRERLIKRGVQLMFKGKPVLFNMSHFNNLCKQYEIKSNERFCWVFRAHKNPQYTYSQQLIEFLCDTLEKEPAVLDAVGEKYNAGRGGGR